MAALAVSGCTGTRFYSGADQTELLAAITDLPTNRYHAGKFVWYDLLTPDAAQARSFYRHLLGWTFEQTGRYTLIRNQGQRIGGIVEVIPQSGDKVESLWLPVMSVADVDQAVQFVQEKGGVILKGPVNMKFRGRGALISDPQGAHLLLLHAADGDPQDTTPGTGDWVWNEIWTNQPRKTSAFYQSLGNYRSTAINQEYEILSNDNRWRGGIRYIFKKEYRTRWVPAVGVKNPEKILEKVSALGGTILVRPDEPPSNGNTALIADPGGALLMLQRWPDESAEEGK